MRRRSDRGSRRFWALLALAGAAWPAAAHGQGTEWRPGVDVTHDLDDRIILNAYVGYRGSARSNAAEVRFPSVGYEVASWLQLWGGLLTLYTDERHSSDRSYELRPFVGVKLSLPGLDPLKLSNYTRFEYRRIEDLNDGSVQQTPRIRNLLGLDFPMSTANPWKPETFYGHVGAEVFHRFDKGGFFERVEARGRIGYIVNKNLKAEATYRAVFTRSSPEASLARGTDIVQLNLLVNF